MKSKVFSVTQINTYIKRMFQSDYALRRISIKGQVSNCKYHSSGHIYFSLKDEESQISCVMFASARYNGLQFELEDGQEVIVDGNVSVYERGGSYQLYAQEIRLNGIGELYVAYEMLKQKLYEEGLFDHEIKKPIPKNPKKIGVVTARTGAAIHDIISTAKRRNPYVQLVLYPAKVQGEGASDTIVSEFALWTSMELIPFTSEEVVARSRTCGHLMKRMSQERSTKQRHRSFLEQGMRWILPLRIMRQIFARQHRQQPVNLQFQISQK